MKVGDYMSGFMPPQTTLGRRLQRLGIACFYFTSGCVPMCCRFKIVVYIALELNSMGQLNHIIKLFHSIYEDKMIEYR